MQIKLWRAANHPFIGGDAAAFSLATKRKCAEGYLRGGGGLGGEDLFSIDVDIDPEKFLDLGTDQWEAVDRLCEFLECNGVSLSIEERRSAWPYKILDNYRELIEEMGIWWVRYPEEYPRGCISVDYYGPTLEMDEAL